MKSTASIAHLPPKATPGLIVIDPTQVTEIPPIVTIEEAAIRLKHCTKWVRIQLRKLKIPVYVVGGKILVPDAHLVLFFQKSLPARSKKANISP